MCTPMPPSPAGSLPASNTSRKGFEPMKPATLAVIGTALGASAGHALRAPFPGTGGNSVLDLIAYHDPGLHSTIRVWYYAAPAIAVVLAGSLCLSVWRVWLQPRARRRGRGRLPAWPTSPNDAAPSLVVGELHHPTVPHESERPSWLVIPETGLYTGVLVVGAVGSGKTTACMYPFAQQLLSWQADRAGRRASALVLEVKGDFCHDVRGIIEKAGRGGDYLEIGMSRLLERLGIKAVPHGFRSSFRDWARRGDRPPPRGGGGGACTRRSQPSRGRLPAHGPVRAAASAHGGLGSVFGPLGGETWRPDCAVDRRAL